MNDKEIKEYVIKNKGLIGQIALYHYRKYKGTLLTYEDFFQEGMIIAMKYLKNYNPRIAKASTYINDCCYKGLSRFAELNTFTLKVPSWIGSKANKYYEFRNRLAKEYKKATPERVAKYFNISEASANSIIKALEGTTTSFCEINEEDSFRFCTNKFDIEKNTDKNLTIEYVRKMINKLPDKEKFVLKERIYTDKTFEIIGNEIGTSKQYAQMLEKSAKKRLKHFIEFDLKNKEVSF